jgi:hypothetical protein
MARHRRTSNPDYFKVAGGSVEDRELAEQARRRVAQQQRKRPPRKKKPAPAARAAAREPAPAQAPPEAPPPHHEPPQRPLTARAARLAWRLYVKLLRAAANRALRRWLPDTR